MGFNLGFKGLTKFKIAFKLKPGQFTYTSIIYSRVFPDTTNTSLQ